MKTVYIASPYTKGDVAVNVRNSLLVAEQLVELGILPFCPLLTHFWHLISPHPYEYWMSMDLAWIRQCDCVLRLPGRSKGADAEVGYALICQKPVYYSVEELSAVLERGIKDA